MYVCMYACLFVFGLCMCVNVVCMCVCVCVHTCRCIQAEGFQGNVMHASVGNVTSETEFSFEYKARRSPHSDSTSEPTGGRIMCSLFEYSRVCKCSCICALHVPAW